MYDRKIVTNISLQKANTFIQFTEILLADQPFTRAHIWSSDIVDIMNRARQNNHKLLTKRRKIWLFLESVLIRKEKIIHQCYFADDFTCACVCVCVYYNRFYVYDVCNFCCFSIEQSMFFFSSPFDWVCGLAKLGERINETKSKNETKNICKIDSFCLNNWFIYLVDGFSHPFSAACVYFAKSVDISRVYTFLPKSKCWPASHRESTNQIAKHSSIW